MAFNLKPRKLYASIKTIRNCSDKSIYQRDEEGPKPRLVHGKEYPEWRKPWIKREGEWYSKLSVFVEKNPSTHVLNAMQKIPNLTYEDVREWWQGIKVLQEIQNQKYIPERVAALGINLAAVHFFTYRQCAVRLRGSKDWISGDILSLNLPDQFVEGYFVEAVDCSLFHHNGMRYEGVQNLGGLNFLKWLSLKNNKHVDIWCLDRIAGQNGSSLEYLDISGCKLTANAVYALSRMSKLRNLIITDPGDDIEVQAALSLLEEENPKLAIRAIEKEIPSDESNVKK